MGSSDFSGEPLIYAVQVASGLAYNDWCHLVYRFEAMKRFHPTFAFAFALATLIACAMTPNTRAQSYTPILVVDGLNNPTGIAIQPETGDVFVAESGAQQVVRIVDGKAKPVIVGFGKDAYGKGPIFDIGPLGLLFLNKNALVVGGGGYPDGEDRVYGFNLPAADAEPIKADNTELKTVKLDVSDDLPPEGNFYGLAKGTKGIYVTCNGDDKKGWVSRVTFNQEFSLTGFKREIATVESVQATAPVAITFSPQGHLVVGQMGTIEAKADSLLTFYSEEGAFLDKFETGLFDITGLAYGPKHGRLFATDFHWTDLKKGGLYKIVATKTDRGCKSVLIANLERPTALAFAPNGDLYVTLAGEPSSAKPDGKLIVFKELDVDNTK